LYRDHGIVLRTWKLGEADRIASLLTRIHGTVRAVAKGARKPRSRFGGRVEPGAHLALQLYAGRGELDTITQAEAVDPMSATRADLSRLGRAAVLLEVAAHIGPDREPNPALYHLLLGALRTLEQQDRPLVVAGFLWKLLAQEGVQPAVDRCLACGTVDDLVAFDPATGGVRCRNCRVGFPLDPEALDVLRAIGEGRLRSVIDLAESPVTRSVERAALASMEHHLERRIRAAAVVADLAPSHPPAPTGRAG
jgi:DNA repair protein RecO (recombination protein O)